MVQAFSALPPHPKGLLSALLQLPLESSHLSVSISFLLQATCHGTETSF